MNINDRIAHLLDWWRCVNNCEFSINWYGEIHNLIIKIIIHTQIYIWISYHHTLSAEHESSLVVHYALVMMPWLFRRRKKKHQSSASLAFVWGIHRWLVNFPHKRPVTRKMFPFDDVIMIRPLRYLNIVHVLLFFKNKFREALKIDATHQ